MVNSPRTSEEKLDLVVDELAQFTAKEIIEKIHSLYPEVVGIDDNTTTYVIGIGALQRCNFRDMVSTYLAQYLNVKEI